MRVSKLINIIYICILTVGICGISYAKWSDISTLVTSITTGNMNYNFDLSGNSLTLISNEHFTPIIIPANMIVENGKYLKIDIIDPSPIMNIGPNDILRINYRLQKGTSNVPLKSKEEDLGLISISLNENSVQWHTSGSSSDTSAYGYLIPTTLGTYQVNHRFDGINGVIDLQPIILPVQPPGTIGDIGSEYLDELVDEDYNEKDNEEVNTEIKADASDKMQKEKIEASSLEDATEKNENQNDISKDETIESNDITSNKDKKGVKKRKKTKILVTKETISFSAEYSFAIPLNFDQFNTK